MKSVRNPSSLSPTNHETPSSSRSALFLSLSPLNKSPHSQKPSDVFCRTRPSTSSLRRSSRNSPQHSFAQAVTIPKEGKLVDKLRTRQNSNISQHITPQLAAEVIQSYILPLFETHSRQSINRVRSETFGFTLPNSPTDSATLFDELKLSIQLLSQLKDAQNLAEELRIQVKEALEREQIAVKSVDFYKEEALKSNTNLKCLFASQGECSKTSQNSILSTLFLASQMRQLQDNLHREEDKSKQLTTLLQEERMKNDKLRNHSAELEYSNSLLAMESAIMGERLKGLYQSIEALTGKKSNEELLNSEIRMLMDRAKEVCNVMERISIESGKVASERDDLRNDFADIAQMRKEVMEEKGKLARLARDRIAVLQKSLQSAEDERDHLKLDAQRQQKRFTDLSEEFGRLRMKMKAYHQRRKAHGEAEERVCKNCQKMFVESENFNWSCRIHQSEYGEDMWWCCGKPGKDAAGCRISKHEGKEDEEDEDNISKKEQEVLRRATSKCPSCREFGHRASECPKDPNYRSKFDLAEESTRIQKMTGTKHKHALPSPEFSAHALNVLATRSGQDQFNDGNVATSMGSEEWDESDMAKDDDEAFSDIQELKAVMPKTSSKVEIEQYLTKNLEKEMSASRLSRARKTNSVSTPSFVITPTGQKPV